MILRSFRGRRRQAATIVESAFVMSLCLLFLFGILEHGRYVMTLQLLDHAAREGCRYAVVHTYDANTAQVQDTTDAALGGMGGELQGYSKTSNITVYKADPTTGANIGTWTDAGFGDSIGVQITGTYKPIMPAFLQMSNSMTVSAVCIMRSEGN
jgi:Flp pilus assembly protein TadG